jgi:hypothetical protein
MDEDGGLLLYAFCENNPISRFDPQGLASYENDGTGFHVHMDKRNSGRVYRVEMDAEGNYVFSAKQTHPFPGAKKARAHFISMLEDETQVRKMIERCIHDTEGKYSESAQRAITMINRGAGPLKKATKEALKSVAGKAGKAGLALSVFAVVVSDDPVQEANLQMIQSVASTGVGYAALSITGETITLTAAGTAGGLVVLVGAGGYIAGEAIAGIPLGDETLADWAAGGVYWLVWDRGRASGTAGSRVVGGVQGMMIVGGGVQVPRPRGLRVVSEQKLNPEYHLSCPYDRCDK